MTRGVGLILRRQLRPFCEGGIKDHRVRACDQDTCRVSGGVARDLSAWRVRRILRVAHGAQSRAVQERPVIEMKNGDWRFRRSLIELIERRHPALSELEFRPPTHNTDPLSVWRSPRLLLQHSETVSERRNAIPTEFEVVVETPADQVHMRVVEAGDHGPLVEVDHLGSFTAKSHHLAIGSNTDEFAVPNGDSLNDRPAVVLGSDLTVIENQIRAIVCHFGFPQPSFLNDRGGRTPPVSAHPGSPHLCPTAPSGTKYSV